MGHQFKALGAGYQLALWTTWRTPSLALLLSLPGTVRTLASQVAAHFTRNSRRSALKNPGNVPLAHALGTANLDGGAFFNAEFDV
ncbi:hypothetical protein GCM10027172_10620 [Halomonas garicola]